MAGKPTGAQVLFLAIGYVVVPIAGLGLLYLLDVPAEIPPTYRLDRLEYVLSHEQTPPADAANWQSLDEPMFDVPNDPFTSAWLRKSVRELGTDDGALTLYVPVPSTNFGVWVDGARRFQTGAMTKPLPYLRSPVLVPLGATSADTGARWIYVRVAHQYAALGPPLAYTGPYAVLQPAFEARRTMVVTLPAVVLGVMGIMVLLVGGLFVMRPQESAYGWYTLTMLLWAGHTAHAMVDHIPIQHYLWFALNYLCLWWVVTDIIFINRFFGFRTPRLEKVIVLVTAVLSLGVLIPGWRGDHGALNAFAGGVWTPWIMACAAYMVGQYVVAVWKRWSSESAGLLLLSSLFVAVGIRDYLFEWHGGVPGTIYYLQYTVVAHLLFFAFLLVRRFVASLREAEALNDQLEARVRMKARELEESYQKLSAEEKKRILAEERTRLMRDMHDGLGGQLIHALALSDRDEDRSDLRGALRSALEDLRLIVDSLAPVDDSLTSLVASYRHRASKAIKRTGIDIRWDIGDLSAVTLGPDRALGLLRIVQESVTNAVRHSGGTLVSIAFHPDEQGQLAVSIADNGCGLAGKARGRGLDNMTIRAEEIGAQLDVDSSAAGTTVRCSLTTAAL